MEDGTKVKFKVCNEVIVTNFFSEGKRFVVPNYYKNEVVSAMMDKFKYKKTSWRCPGWKVIVNMGVGEAGQSKPNQPWGPGHYNGQKPIIT